MFQDGAALRPGDYPGIAVEAEIAVTLARDVQGAGNRLTTEDVRAAIGTLHVAIEILASRFVDRKKVPPLAGIADLQHSGAVVVGPGISPGNWPELSHQALSLEMDGTEIARTAGNSSTENMLTSLAWLANHAVAYGLPLKAGDVVITGARLGPLALEGSQVVVKGAGLGSVSARFS